MLAHSRQEKNGLEFKVKRLQRFSLLIKGTCLRLKVKSPLEEKGEEQTGSDHSVHTLNQVNNGVSSLD